MEPNAIFIDLTAQELLEEVRGEIQQGFNRLLQHGFNRLSQKLAEDIKTLHESEPLPLKERYSVDSVGPVSSLKNRRTTTISLDDLARLQSQTKDVHVAVLPGEQKPSIEEDRYVRFGSVRTVPESACPVELPATPESRMASRSDNLDEYRRGISSTVSSIRRYSFHREVAKRCFPQATAKSQGLPYRCAMSRPFNFTCMALIVMNAIWLGYEADHDKADWHEWVNISFTIWFIVELFFKVIALTQYFLTGPEWKWNLFDVVLVLLSIPELFAPSLNVSLMRIIRLTKLTKTLRIVRVLRFAKSLREILMTVLLTFGTLFWCFVAIIAVTYTSAIMILEGLHMSLDEDVQFSDDTMYNFRSVWSTMMALFSMITGGQEWYAFALDFETHGAYFPQYMLTLWIYFMMFGFLNIVLAVFCAQGTEATLADVELRLESEAERRKSKLIELVNIWKMIDTSECGVIQWEQFRDFGQGPEGQSYLQLHGLELFGLRDVWKLMDKFDGSNDGLVDLPSFIIAFNRLSGENLGTELVLLSKEMTALRQEFRDALRDLRYQNAKDLEVFPMPTNKKYSSL